MKVHEALARIRHVCLNHKRMMPFFLEEIDVPKSVVAHNAAVFEDRFDVFDNDESHQSSLWYGANTTTPSLLVSKLAYCQEYECIGDDTLICVLEFQESNILLAQNL